MPESVKDRPTRAHEYIFLFTKEEQYGYHADAVLEESEDGGKRNRRTVWSINTSATNGSHIASFPQELVEPCVLAGTQPGDFVLDPFFGCGTVGLACRRLNRKFIGIELNPDYVDQAMEFLGKQSLNPTSKRRIRYDANKHADQLAFFEAASQRRVLS